ncbi:MAG: radical SAM protein [Candidatus Omnitrophota bacterium]|jgi:radical SAM superfamily enzyme YgiQ (UPF0313 family)
MCDKIILATVNCKKQLYSTTADEFSAVAPNIQMGLLTAYVKAKEIDCRMIESDVDRVLMDDLIDRVALEKPLLFGVICTGANPSSSTMTMAGIVEFFEKVRARKEELAGVKMFIWGPHPTVLPERSLKETGADFIVRGEGYETIVNLYHVLHSGGSLADIAGLAYYEDCGGEKIYVQTVDAPLVKDLDVLPTVDWKTMNPLRYRAHNWHCFGDVFNRSPYAIIWTSFGCPFKCNFCCINNLFGKRTQRFRSVDSVVNEISLLVERYGVKHIKILDELFVVKPKRIEEFCDKLEAKNYDLNMWAYSRVDTINRRLLRRLKKVGLNWISYGFESATSEILLQAEKGCKTSDVDQVIRMTQEEGVNICADVMFGLWEEDIASMQRTYAFLLRYNFEWVNMYPVFPYPGTELYDYIEEPGSWKGYSLYGYECYPMPTKHVPAREVLRFRDEAFIRYHSRPEYLQMIEGKFGAETREHILRMLATPLKRRLLEDAACPPTTVLKEMSEVQSL